MKTLILFMSFVISFSFFVNGQENYPYPDNFPAYCNNELYSSKSLSKYIYVENDSIIIEDVIFNQCCPQSTLQISDIINDSVFVAISDIASIICLFMCNFDVRINVGKATS